MSNSRQDTSTTSTTTSKPKKKPRERTSFQANVAASISLPSETSTTLMAAPSALTFMDLLGSIGSSTLRVIQHTPDFIRTLASINLADLRQQNMHSLAQIASRSLNNLSNLRHLPTLFSYNRQALLTQTSSHSIKDRVTEAQERINHHKAHPGTQTDKKIADEQLTQVESVKRYIVEHAARRVDLFFYLLVGVYNTGIEIDKDKTLLQNGVGSRKSNTQACHHSLFPNVSFKPVDTSNQSLFNKLLSTFWANQQSNLSLEGTHFMESLNATMELPKMVNDFDGHLEGRWQLSSYVESCINILNRTSKGETTPIEGMHLFFNRLNDFFIHYENKYIKTDKASEAEKKIWEYQQQGSFKAAKSNFEVDMNYVYMMLHINTFGESARAAISLASFYKQIQNEIFNTPSMRSKPTS